MLDYKLIEALEREAIRLLRVEWLLAQPDGFKLPRRQDLEILERSLKGVGLSPLLRGEEAVALMRNGEREVGALSYGWLLPWDPDPTGERMALLRLVLSERPYIKALFWDQATLYQLPRSVAEEALFQDALLVMMDLYASAIGTTCALQIRTHPDCSPLTTVSIPAVCCRSRTFQPDRLSSMGCFAWEACGLTPRSPRSESPCSALARSTAAPLPASQFRFTKSSSSRMRQPKWQRPKHQRSRACMTTPLSPTRAFRTTSSILAAPAVAGHASA